MDSHSEGLLAVPVRRVADSQTVKGPGKGLRTKTPPDAAAPVRVFISYCHRDDGARDRLDVHMTQLKREGVSVFFDGDMIAGTELDPRIRRELRLAEIFVALASPAYLHSRYCFETEYGYALRKAKRGGIHLVVALVEECQWRHTRMARYKLLPRDGKPVSKWRPHGASLRGYRERPARRREGRQGAAVYGNRSAEGSKLHGAERQEYRRE